MFEEYTVVCYGCGRDICSYLGRLSQAVKISFVSDKDEKKWGNYYSKDRIECIPPEDIEKQDNPYVIITLDNPGLVEKIKEQFKRKNIPSESGREILNKVNYNGNGNWLCDFDKDHIHKFIDLAIDGTTNCNFHCDYCYVWRRFGFEEGCELSSHSPEEIARGFSFDKTGGTCFINMCASGETFLTKGINELIVLLLKEGHFVAVVTNGTCTKPMEELLKNSPNLLERMFFKLSYHHNELKKRNLMERFWKNVEMIKKSPCSYTLEITPYDGLMDEIQNIKEIFSDKADGTMPHISYVRDSTKTSYELYSKYDKEEFTKIWQVFDSPMFDLKSDLYGKKITDFCYAGTWSYLVSATTGDIKACYRQEFIANIFDEDFTGFPDKPVGEKCPMDYCFNNHAFLAWGTVPRIECSNYREMRDRVEIGGEHWVKQPVYGFMNEKLYENNYDYANGWNDYCKLFEKKNEKKIILFNSPDYENIGDHMIALGQKKFFNERFPMNEFVEISCLQFQKERKKIVNAINSEDLILISGGGNIGDLWLRIEDYTIEIISTFNKNQIVVLPQSVSFSDSNLGETEKKMFQSVCNGRNNVLFFVRDKKSYDLMVQILGTKKNVFLAPDMAINLAGTIHCNSNKSGAAYCFRNDKESSLTDKNMIVKRAKGKWGGSIEEINSINSVPVLLKNREQLVYDFFEKVSGYKKVYTDRLHVMIACALCGTECETANNSTGKVSGAKKWLGNMEETKKTFDKVEEQIKKAWK